MKNLFNSIKTFLFIAFAIVLFTACSPSEEPIVDEIQMKIEQLQKTEASFENHADYILAKLHYKANKTEEQPHTRRLACASENVIIHSVGFGFYEVFFLDSNDEMFSVGTYWYSTVNSVGWCNMLNQ